MDEKLQDWLDEDVVLVVDSTSMTSKNYTLFIILLEDIAMKAAETKNVVGIAICGDISPVGCIVFL